MRAGDLRRRVTIQQRSESRDTAGQRVLSWTDFCTVPANILPLTGRELELAQAMNVEIRHSITIRYRAEVVTSMRAKYQERIFNILAVLDVETRHREMTLLCSEGLNDGQ